LATIIPEHEFERVTGEPDFPAYLAGHIKDGKLEYFCNNSVHYVLRGVHVKLDILWNWEAAPGTGDTYTAVFRGTRARVEIRQGAEQKYVPELYVVPNSDSTRAEVLTALQHKIDALQGEHPGVGFKELGGQAAITIPAATELATRHTSRRSRISSSSI